MIYATYHVPLQPFGTLEEGTLFSTHCIDGVYFPVYHKYHLKYPEKSELPPFNAVAVDTDNKRNIAENTLVYVLDDAELHDTDFETKVDAAAQLILNATKRCPPPIDTDTLKKLWQTTNVQIVPDSCKYCPNHPSNGGSGICHCILGTPQVT